MNEIWFYEDDSSRKPIHKYMPGAWGELSKLQLRQVLEVRARSGTIDGKVLLFIAILLNLSRRWRLARYLKKRLGPAGLTDTALFTEFLFTTPEIPNNRFPILKIPSLWSPTKWLYGPPLSKLLNYMIFLEWIKTETYYRQYLAARSEGDKRKALNKLVAALYRPKVTKPDPVTHNGDPREPYNDHRVESTSRQIAKVSIGIRLAIFYHFQTHRERWAKQFNHVYGGTDDRSTQDQQPQQPSDIDLFRAMKNMAGGALHMEQMAMVPASVALLDLDDKIEENQKLKEKLDAAH